MSSNKFAIADLTTGQLNALVKNLMRGVGIKDPIEAVRLVNDGQVDFQLIEQEKPSLLETITTISLVGERHFVAREKFREGKTTGGVSIAWLSDDFKKNFLDKVEENVPEAELRISRLKESSRDIPIITEVGGEEVAETTLAYLWELLKLQGNGETGVLFTNGYANIFYIRDTNGVLWAVFAYWLAGDRGWSVGAFSVEGPFGWIDGYQVVSRDS